jgi:hypothetical protein
MKVLFLTAGMEPGRDGVGDYTRMLAEELSRRGHPSAVIALNDPTVSPISRAVHDDGEGGAGQLRLPRTMPWRERLERAQRFVDAMKPDWASLQFVAYGYHPKGMAAGLAGKFKPLIGGRPLHVMFHELWIGAHSGAEFKERLTGMAQRFFVKRLLGALKPRVVHTSTSAYVHLLRQAGAPAERLPMFGALPVTTEKADEWLLPELRKARLAVNEKIRPAYWLIGFFGTLHPVWPPEPFFSRLRDAATAHDKKVGLISIGRLGPGEALWDRLAEEYSDRFGFLKLGEQPAEKVSAVFNSLDFAVATTPASLIGKSATAAAMLEHDLPVIVNREDCPFKGVPPDADHRDGNIIRVNDEFAMRLGAAKPRHPKSRLPQIAERMLAALTAAGARTSEAVR